MPEHTDHELAVKVSQWLTQNIGQAVNSPNKRVIHTEEMLRNLQKAWFPEPDSPVHVIHIPPDVLSQEHLPDLVRYIEGQVGTSVQVTTLYPRTPPWLFAKLNREFGFTVDVCASDWNAKCKKYWTKEQDGLQQDWSNEICWMNPPYGQDLEGWIHKAYSESLKGATVVCLVPVAPDRSWWHDYVIKRESELRWIRQTTAAPFPRCIAIFRPPQKVEEREQ